MAWTFKAGDHVLLVEDGAVVERTKVKAADEHFAILVDGSKWYHAGYPVTGRGNRRITIVTPEVASQLEATGRLRRLAELATVIVEISETTTAIPDSELEAAERQLMRVVQTYMPAGTGSRIWERLRAAEAGRRTIVD